MKKAIYLVLVLLFSLIMNADTLLSDTSDLAATEDAAFDVGLTSESLKLTDLFQASATDANVCFIDFYEADLFTVILEDCLWGTAIDIDAIYNLETSATIFDTVAEGVILLPEPMTLSLLDLDDPLITQ